MTLRVGLVGCGAIARRGHLPAFRKAGADLVDVVAFASRSRPSAEAAASDWGSGVVRDGWRELIEAPDVDAVDICSPNRSHAPIAIAAAEAGKHVLVEKPMACSVAEADAMIAAATAHGITLSVAHNLRDVPAFHTAQRLVARGALGQVVGFRAAFGHRGPHQWAPDAAWFYDPDESGGGALIDLGIHVADLIRFVLADDVAEVSALVTRLTLGVDAAAQVILRMTGGALGTVHASWTATPGPDHQLTVFGTEATMHFDRGSPLTLLRGESKPEVVTLEVPADDVYTGFVRACLAGAAGPVTAEDGRAALAVIEAAYRSADSGRVTAPDPPPAIRRS